MNYHTGRVMGVQFRKRSDTLIVKYLMRHLPKAEEFYRKYGTRAIIIGRFFPIFRTYVPFVAGMIRMERKIFLKYSAAGPAAACRKPGPDRRHALSFPQRAGSRVPKFIPQTLS
jgi:membrane-associated protein